MGFYKRVIEQGMSSNRKGWSNKSNNFSYYAPLDVTIVNKSAIEQYERQKDTKAVEAFNDRLRGWGYKVRQQLVMSVKSNIHNDRILSDSLKVNYWHWGKKVRPGFEITSIGFSFVEEGIYVHLGVGRGYVMQNGTRVITKKNDNEWRREPVEWFNTVIKNNIKDLENIVKDYCGKLVIDTTRIYIND